MNSERLSAVLWHERELLEMLVFKLEEQQLILVAGKSKWLERATDEIGGVAEDLKDLSLSRDITIEGFDGVKDGEGYPSLQEIIDRTNEPVWQDIFTGHLGALRTLTENIRTLQEANEGLIRSALRSTQETLAGLDADTVIYDASGLPDLVVAGTRMIETDM